MTKFLRTTDECVFVSTTSSKKRKVEGADTVPISSGSEVLRGGSFLRSEKFSPNVMDGDSTSHSSAPHGEIAMANVNGIVTSPLVSIDCSLGAARPSNEGSDEGGDALPLHPGSLSYGGLFGGGGRRVFS